MIEPHVRGAFARAVIAALCLFLMQAFIVVPHAHAGGRRYRREQFHYHAMFAHPHNTGRIAIDTRIGAIEPRWSAGFGSLFQPPAPPAPPFAEVVVRPIESATRAIRGVAVAAMVRAKAEALGVPPQLALAVARFESGFHMAMRGAAGERGAMQVLPQTARQVGVTGNLYGEAGIEAGVRYLKLALALHRRDGWCAVASAYNSGVWRGPRCTHYGRAVVALAALR